jgi:pimeloyl-ACP methyl ester carboxylesterase
MPSTFIDFLLRNLGLEAAGAGLSGVKMRGTLTGAPSFGPATGADFVSIDNSGHMIPMEQPLVLARVVSQWLDRVLAA